MAESATSESANVDFYFGSLICLITKFEIRYEGFLFHLDAKEATIGLRNVKSFGTEGRRKDGPQFPPSDKIYDYIYFRGNDIKDLQVLSSPSVQSTSFVPDDPAIIQPRHPHPPPATISLASPSASQATNLCSNAQSGLQAPSSQGNLPPHQSVEVSMSLASMVPAPPPVNVNGPAAPNYWPGFTGLPVGTSHFQQQPFPPPPQSLVLINPVQQPTSMNVSLAGNALNFTEPPCPLPPPLCTVFNSSSQMVSSLDTGSDLNPVIPSVAEQAQSLLGPAPFQIISKSISSALGTSGASHGKTSITSHAHINLQPGLGKLSSSQFSTVGNDDAEITFGSTSNAANDEPSNSENAEEAAPQQPKPLTIKLHEPASSSHYANRRRIQDQGDGMHRSNRGRAQGRGRGNGPNRAAMHHYQSYRGHPVGKGNEMIGAPLYHRHLIRCPGRENGPNATWYPSRYVGSHARGGGSKVSPSATRFTEDFDFEAMNKKFNKEEVWGRLGKNKQAGAEDSEGDEKEGNGSDAQDEAADELQKVDHAPAYCKDDFFDSLSCRALDAESRRGKIKISEQRRIDAETFGEIPKPKQNCGPQRGGSSHGSYRGRGSGNAGRGRARAYWNRGTQL